MSKTALKPESYVVQRTSQRNESTNKACVQRKGIRSSPLTVETGPMLEKISLETLLSGDLATPRLDGKL